MPWIEIEEAAALTAVNAPTLEATRTKAKKAGQADPLTETIAKVVALVHGAVAASGRYILGPEGTIPARLEATALDILAVRMLGRLDLEIPQAKELLYKSAEATLKAVAAGTFDCDVPLVPSAEPSSAPTPRIKPRCRRFRRQDGDGA
jgi:hypothetical protein